MPRRNAAALSPEREDQDVPLTIRSPCRDLKRGSLLQDLVGNVWRLGKTVGVGGFGEIFLAGKGPAKDVKTDTPYVAKVESHSSGPLFVEINCYLRIAKTNMIEDWKTKNKLEKLGMPNYIASGSHSHGNTKYRFLIIPRFETDLETLLKAKKKFNIKTVLLIVCQILDVLEYMHSNGYIHSDIKASNILLGCTKNQESQALSLSKAAVESPVARSRVNHFPGSTPLRTRSAKTLAWVKRKGLRRVPTVNYCEGDTEDIFEDDAVDNSVTSTVSEKQKVDSDLVYLVDFGLAAKYVGSDGQHKCHEPDERKAHAGTVLFCSRDAHSGIQSRRSDLESLAYNMIYWLTGSLPWYENLSELPEVISKKKQRCFANLNMFLQSCFPFGCPKFLQVYFKYLSDLEVDATPDYAYCKRLFIRSLKEYGYKNDQKLDFDNVEGWGRKQKKFKRSSENKNIITLSVLNRALFVGQHRLPLHSNNHSIIRPLLRKKAKAKKLHKMMTWSKILMNDPEVILKQAKSRERKVTETSDTTHIFNMDIETLNPTYAMLEVYNRCKERNGNTPQNRGDWYVDSVEGFTPAMMSVYSKIKEREEMERAQRSSSAKLGSKKGRKSVVGKRGKKRNSNTHATYSPPKLRACRSNDNCKKQVGTNRKNKITPLKRTYSLRG